MFALLTGHEMPYAYECPVCAKTGRGQKPSTTALGMTCEFVKKINFVSVRCADWGALGCHPKRFRSQVRSAKIHFGQFEQY
jgi:hypothetical protein